VRHPAAALGLAALTGCTVAGPRSGDEPRPTDPAVIEVEEPSVRVGLQVGADAVELGGSDLLALTDEGGRVLARGAGPWAVRRDGDRVTAQGAGGETVASGQLIARPDGSGTVRVDGTAYRGAIALHAGGAGITVVNLLDLETYLLGVVPMEIGGGRPPEELEAVKAQAIAARTYAIRHLERRDDLGFDYWGSHLDQAYGGADGEDEVTTRAVRDTRGEVLVYDGEPIEAYYHSTCGGRTAALEEVWNGRPREYLRSVSDRRPDGGWYCESSNRFRWTAEWSAEELRTVLTRAYRDRGHDGSVTDVESITVLGHTPSGRVEALRIRTNLGEEVVRGDSIRWVLRPDPDRLLNSSAIALIDRDGRDGLMVEGAGWGHGIGMCQVGALGRARDGHSYREILHTYYPETRIARLYR
jgi:stage II sporulation protein D